MTRRLLLSLALLPVLVSAGDWDWLAKVTSVCSEGAISAACKCGGAKVTTGYCSGDVAYVLYSAFDAPGCYASGTVVGSHAYTVARNSTRLCPIAAGEVTCQANEFCVTELGILASEPVATQFYPAPSAPAAGTTASLATGVWTFSVYGTYGSSQTMAVTTAVATGLPCTATPYGHCTFTVTSAGTVNVGAVTGTLTRAQVEKNYYPTTFVASGTRATELISFALPVGPAPSSWCVGATVTPYLSRIDTSAAGHYLWEGGRSGAGVPNTLYGVTVASSPYPGVLESAIVDQNISSNTYYFGSNARLAPPVGGTHRFEQCSGAANTGALYNQSQIHEIVTGTGLGAVASFPTEWWLGANHNGGGQSAYFLRRVTITGRNTPAASLAGDWAISKYAVGCWGDSLTSGDTQCEGHSYCVTLGTILGKPWRVYNWGRSGFTSTQVVDLWNGVIRTGPRGGASRFSGVSHALLMMGINDIWFGSGNAAPTIEAKIQEFITGAEADGVKVLVSTILPFRDSSQWTTGREADRVAFNTWLLNTYCPAHSTVTCIDLATFADDGSGYLKSHCSDYLHWDDTLADSAAAFVAPYVTP